MTTLWRKLQVPSKLNIFCFEKLYRKSPKAIHGDGAKADIEDRINSCVNQIDFLEVDLSRGSPVDTSLSSKTPDPYLERFVEQLVQQDGSGTTK
ncbi:hypothetical protein BdWA1_000856 [Babesia duncani]|uniref:Uncharacterized protein n=1 Tax=Babesia duncani TaxID=323732 RepID=A0AAD9PN59_9APIC|nr:hypothetical protein BdWA1_000856 [Babesia duncani]